MRCVSACRRVGVSAKGTARCFSALPLRRYAHTPLRRRGQRGAILIVVLWVVLGLAMIAVSFSASVREEAVAARGLVDVKQSYYFARAGVSYAIYQILRSRMMQATPEERLQRRNPDPVEVGQLRLELSDGFADIEVMDETGKLNVNSATEEMLRALMLNVGIDPVDADIIVDSIQDWKDLDRDYRLNGAEDDFYRALERPYLAKNAQIDVPEELLLIRGLTPEYFYGQKTMVDGQPVARYGLTHYLTTFTSSGNRINANSAPLPVLMSLPGIDQAAAEAIVRERQQRRFEGNWDVGKELSLQLPANAAGMLNTFPSLTFSIVSTGGINSARVKSVIRCTFMIDAMSQGQRGYRILYWNENNLET